MQSIKNMNDLYNVPEGSMFYADGKFLGYVSETRVKYGNVGIQVILKNFSNQAATSDGYTYFTNTFYNDEDVLHNKVSFIEN